MPVINIELPNTGTFSFNNSGTSYDLQARHDIVRISENRFLAYIQQFDRNLGLTCLIEFDDLVNSDNYTVLEYKIVNTSHFKGVRLYKIAENRVLGVFDTHIKIFDVVNDEVIITKEQSSVLTRGTVDIDSYYTNNWQYLHYDRFYATSIKENELLLIEKETSSNRNPDYRFKKLVYDPIENTVSTTTIKSLSTDTSISPITDEFELMNALIKPIPGTSEYLLTVSLTTWNDLDIYRYGYSNGIYAPYYHRGINNYSKYDIDFCVKYVARIDQNGTILTTYSLPGVTSNGTNTLAANDQPRVYAAIPLRDNLIVYLASVIHQGHMHSVPYTLYNGVLKEGFSFRALNNYYNYSIGSGRTAPSAMAYYPIYTIIPDIEPLDDNTFLVNYITSNTIAGYNSGNYVAYMTADNTQRSEFVIMQLKSDLVLEEGTVRNIGDPNKHKPTRKNILDKLTNKVYIAYRPITIVNNLVNFNFDRIDLR